MRASSGACILLVVLCAITLCAQTNQVSVTDAGGQPSSAAPLTITLQDALQRARQNNPQYRAAATDFALAKENRVQSRAALLPSVNYNTQILYTEGNNTPTGRFIASNAVHEYAAQGNVHQEISLENFAGYRRASAAQTLAQARAEIAARGLVVTVVQAYYGFAVAQRKYATAQRAAGEAQRFLDISQKLEKGGEVAHSDSIKAQIQYQQQERELQDAELGMNRSRLELAVLLFPDFNQDFAIVDDLQPPEPLPAFPEIQAAAARNNPELRAAVAALQEARHEVTAAWNGFLPSLSFDYFYGIDSSRFAVHQFDPSSGQVLRNLGYAATATLQLPVWNWGSNRSKLKQADLRQQQAHVELSFAQRRLLSDLQAFYDEAQTARTELDSLSESAALAAESSRLTILRYQAGEATVLEVVDAQNTLTSARNAFDDGQARYRLAMANLQTLTGTL